jgi:PAS domain S-box-containing protein
MPPQQTVQTLAQRIKELEKSKNHLEEIIAGLREKEEHLRFLTEETLLPIVIIQEEQIVYANRAYAELTEYSLEEILQWKLADTVKLIHPDYRDFVMTQAQKKLHGEKNDVISNYQYKGVRKNGEDRWVDQYSRTVYYDGKPADMISMIDITPYKQAEEALRESEERYKALFERSNDCIYINDFEGNFIDANPAALELLGYRKEEIQSLNFASLLSEDQLSKAFELMQEVIRTGFMKKLGEYRLKRKDGTFVDAEIKTSVIHRHGKPYAVQGVARDVTERKRADEALQKSEERYRDLYENAPIAYFSARTVDASLIRFNSAAMELTGYNRDEGLNLTVFDLYSDMEEDRAKAYALYERLKRGESIRDEELRVKHKSGRHLWVSYSVEPVRDENGNVIESRSMFVDISERKRLQLQLQESQKMEAIATLAGGIAHQFNNALFVIKGNIDLMKLGLVNKEGISDWTNQITGSVSRMTGLTSQLLAYAKGGKYAAKIMSLRNFIKDALPLLEYIVRPSVTITYDLSDEDTNIYADQTQIQMVLSAILANASEAVEDKGHIRIAVGNAMLTEDAGNACQGLNPGKYACLVISDNGKGMDENIKSRLFEPFFTTKFQGRGLGMAAAYGIIKNHDGWMSVDSEPGKGTSVTILLPLQEQGCQ